MEENRSCIYNRVAESVILSPKKPESIPAFRRRVVHFGIFVAITTVFGKIYA